MNGSRRMMGCPGSLPDRSRSFAVVVHDVAPTFFRELVAITEALFSRVGTKLIGAVVPCWHGCPLGASRGDSEARFLRLIGSAFGEVLQHGYTHRQDRPGVISFFTGRADELSGLTRDATRDRLVQGRMALHRALGVAVSGFVAPAWQNGHATSAELGRLGFRYLVGFDAIQPAGSPPIPLVTWSWDWGILAPLGRVGECFATACARVRPDALPCVVVHPADLARGYLPRIFRVIDRLERQGRTPALFSDLVPLPPRELAR